jgi:hypothetical protein
LRGDPLELSKRLWEKVVFLMEYSNDGHIEGVGGGEPYQLLAAGGLKEPGARTDVFGEATAPHIVIEYQRDP